MDYGRIYTDLMIRAETRKREPGVVYEKHHATPRSLGGTDTPDNIVFLTIREHYLAHLLLFKLGFNNQIFSVECFLKDSIDVRSHRFGLFRYKRWIRRAIAYRRAANIRTEGKLRASVFKLNQTMKLEREYNLRLQAIEERYATSVLAAAFDESESY